MKEELVDKANAILTMLVNGLEKAGDLATSEVPLILKEYIEYYIIQQFPLNGILWLIFAWIPVLLLVRHVKGKIIKEPSDQDQRCFNSGMQGIIYATIGFYVFINVMVMGCVLGDLKTVYTIKTAPKAYLIEKFRK